MLSQQDMEDFMEIEAALVEEDEDAAKPGKPSNATPMPVTRCAPCLTCSACTTTTSRRVCGACCQLAIKSLICWHRSPGSREPELFRAEEAVRRLHGA
jgi:hypothetical protein